MRIDVITLFPELVGAVASYGVVSRAAETGLLQLESWNPRDYTEDRHRRVDERAYGGGPGMVMQIDPLRQSLGAAHADRGAAVPVVALTPHGEPFSQNLASRLAQGAGFVLVCGRYEGMDERFVDTCVDLEVSIGDYVVSGGELPAMVVIDAVTRLLPGALGHTESAQQDSFVSGLLDHPHYTRPRSHADGDVPDVLLSGDHAAINRWRLKQALGQTWLKRPELIDEMELDALRKELLREFIADFSADH